MKLPRIIRLLPLALFPFLITSCRKDAREQTANENNPEAYFKSPPVVAEQLLSNQLADEPTQFLRRNASSAINWQPWTKDVFPLAEKAQRLVFVFVGSAQYPNSQQVLNVLGTEYAAQINSKFVPVLADLEADPALALACNQLSGETRTPIIFPFFLWMSHEGHPVAWNGVNPGSKEDYATAYRRAENTVLAVLEESTSYVIGHSSSANAVRLELIHKSLEGLRNDEDSDLDPAEKAFNRAEASRIAFDLASLYDPISQVFDEVGGLPPFYLLQTLSLCSEQGDISSRLQKNIRQIVPEALEQISRSALSDPLDHYFFSRQLTRDFSVPALSKNLSTQSGMLAAYALSPELGPISQRILEELAKELPQNNFTAFSLPEEIENFDAMFWRLETIEGLLTAEEFAVAELAFALRKLGNISGGEDPQKKYFKLNSLGLKKAPSEIAAKLGKSEQQVEQIYQNLTAKIRTAREEALKSLPGLLKEDTKTLSEQARLLSAYARIHQRYPEQYPASTAVQLYQNILASHQRDQTLYRISPQGSTRAVSAFAGDYIKLIKASYDLYRISNDPKHLAEALKFTQQLLEKFGTDEGLISEYETEDDLLKFPVYNFSMIFDNSTWDYSYRFLNRMESLGLRHHRLKPALKILLGNAQSLIRDNKITRTDFLESFLLSEQQFVLRISPENLASLKSTLTAPEFQRLLILTPDAAYPAIPDLGADQAVLVQKGQTVARFSTSEEILPGLRRSFK